MMHPQYTEDFARRFWSRVHKTETCWLWTGRLEYDGYARAHSPLRRESVHRIAYQLQHGPIPDRLLVCHRCDVRHCCNPNHLFLGTHLDNMLDMVAKGHHAWHLHPELIPRRHPHRILQGEEVASSRLTEGIVREIRRRYATGNITQKELGVMFGIRRQHISRIVNRQAWTHVP